MEEYVIHVTKTEAPWLDGTWGVGFSVDKTDPSGKDVTFCLLRKADGYYFVPHAGCSVKNPKDDNDILRGKRTAFKRAVESLVPGWMPGKRELLVDRFRGALWIAMGRPGYFKKENELLNNSLESMLPELNRG